jgi:curli biogenesis system outer membrane secretion channel CsgG
MKRRIMIAAMAALASLSLTAAPKPVKWLVLDPIKYQTGVDRVAFEGIDKLLLTKLVQAKKYKCLDRDMYDTAAREEGFGGKADLVPAGYAMSGEIVQLVKSGKTRSIAGESRTEYIATVSIRANDLRTQQPYEADTLRVAAYCQTPKDMLVHVVKRVALSILMRDYPMYVMDVDEDDGELTLSYGADFLEVGEQYEVRHRKAIIDEDTGEEVYKEKLAGVCRVTDVGKNTSEACLVSGKAKKKDVLRFYDDGEGASAPLPEAPVASAPVAGPSAAPARPVPVKKPRVAVAPFITKSRTVSVWGNTIGARDWIDVLVDHMSIQLVNTGSFRTLDRSFGPEIDRELNRIVSDPNANPKDVCRLSNKLATDYLIVADVMFSDVASPGTDYVTGLPLPPASAQFAEIRFRCVHAPTTEIIASDVVRVDSQYFYGTVETFTSGSAEWAAANMASIIQSRLDPAGFAARQARLQAAAAAEAEATPPPPPPAPARRQGISLGF